MSNVIVSGQMNVKNRGKQRVMRKILNVLLTAVVLLSLGMVTGCTVSHTDPSLKSNDPFPQCLVGVWKSNKFGWAFKFEPDGTIKKLHHVIFRYVDMDEPVVELPGPEEGTYALYAMGDCKTNYDPQTRTLEVSVILEDFVMQLPNGKLQGRGEDYFSGQVSKDCETWDVQWRNYSWLEGALDPDPNIVEANPEPLVFTKVDLSEMQYQAADPNTVQ